MSTLRDYAVPFLLAVLVHLAAVLALWSGWTPQERESLVVKPHIVRAELVVLDKPAQAKPKPAPPKAAPPKPAPQPAKKEPPPQAKKEPPKPPAPPKPDPAKLAAEKARQEAERRRQEEAERRKALDSLVASSFDQALQQEATSIAASEQEQLAQTYAQGIYQLIVANWSRPPSARNGMVARLMVELVPTGDVVNVTVVQSSGNAAFDRSAEQAVRRAGKFDVPKDTSVFERYFRRFPVVFKPEDLLR